MKKWGLRLGLLFFLTMFFSAAFLTWWSLAMAREASGISSNRLQDYFLDLRVEQKVAKMSDEEKIGQLLMIGLPGTAYDQVVQDMQRDWHVGGVVYFDRNMENPEQVRRLSDHLQQAAQKDTGLPLFLAVDEEGGNVARMRKYLPVPPSEASLATANDLDKVKGAAEKNAEELKKLGFNVVFAPVVDLGLGRERSYGTAPQQVTRLAAAALQGYRDKKILYTLKHFPGIGKLTVNPHQEASGIPISSEDWQAEDGKPFRDLIAAGPQDFFIMVSHLSYPAMDGDRPASLSPYFMTEVLRHQLGFEGIVITDDMEMGAVSRHYSFRDIGVLAVNAGADIVLVCHDPQHQKAAYEGMLDGLHSGKLNRQRVEDSVRRIVKMKLQKLPLSPEK